MEYPYFEFGGQDKLMHLAVANGFPPAIYRPMISPLLNEYRVVSVLPRALWKDTQVPEHYVSWSQGLAKDLYNGFDTHQMTDMVAIGHSFGGIATLLSVIHDPARFRALILLDPTLILPELLQAMAQSYAEGTLDTFPLAARAIRRKRRFESHEEALSYFAEKRLFADWDQEALRLYAYEAFEPDGEGGVKLVWSPEWEAYYFKTIETQIWNRVGELNGLVPTLVLRGSASDTFLEAGEQKMQKLVPSASYQVIEGHGHLFPMSAPKETANSIANFLQSL